MERNNHAHSAHTQHSNFWFGLVMGGVAGGSLLYFLGTKNGRKQLRDILELIEDIDSDLIEEFVKDLGEGDPNSKNVTSNIHSLLDKIQETLPAKEVKKYFVKDGKLLK
ncbi:hypothetical protein A2957_03480 [Candidatus Roizmanbacteria bacterium RIFCSPLOWO2_01_FULL_38_11]|uniref:YtxH domain-containing protein n=1 Tax=Candidatus Roizmanbacteria bacterium RIFCSPLOWO2_01_FULL_38_11 TaxID=1802060 RepID=A0A1F7INH9_9BACT|nr:MAG: hypothetical protein A2957_03480 [Candidatus Roizmanbacteria bacterium RIFCSPLOWO2_01_FULL_38_11]